MQGAFRRSTGLLPSLLHSLLLLGCESSGIAPDDYHIEGAPATATASADTIAATFEGCRYALDRTRTLHRARACTELLATAGEC